MDMSWTPKVALWMRCRLALAYVWHVSASVQDPCFLRLWQADFTRMNIAFCHTSLCLRDVPSCTACSMYAKQFKQPFSLDSFALVVHAGAAAEYAGAQVIHQ